MAWEYNVLAQLGIAGPISPGPRVINSKDQFSANKAPGGREKNQFISAHFPISFTQCN